MCRFSIATLAFLVAVMVMFPVAQSRAQTVGSATEGSWLDPDAPGQGLVFDYLDSSGQVFGAWFTFTADGSGATRWYTLQSSDATDPGQMTIFETSGGQFVMNTPVSTMPTGTAVLIHQSCDELDLTFDFNTGMSGIIALHRLLPGDGGCVDPAPDRIMGDAMAISGVDVLTMDTPARLHDQTLLIADGMIQQIFPTATQSLPADVIEIRLDGALVIPGLVDAHTHLATNVVELLGFSAPQREIERAGQHQLLLYLAKGVTTIINNGDFGEPLPLWASQTRSGMLEGPTIYSARYARGGQATCDRGPPNVTVTGDSQARQFVRQAANLGYDFIKTYNCTPTEALTAIMDEAAATGTPVIGHLPQTLGVSQTLAMGMQMIAHAEAFVWTLTAGRHDQRMLPTIVDVTITNDVWVTGTLSILELIAQVWGNNTPGIDAYWARDDTRYMHPTEVGLNRRSITSNRFNPTGAVPGGFDARRDYVRDIVRSLSEAHARLLIGTDSPTVLGVAGFSMYDELEAYLRAGLSADQTLRIATRNGGDFVLEQLPDETERFGRVVPGYRADLIVLAEDPGSNLGSIERLIAGVIARGRWYSRSYLDGRLQEVAEDYAR